MLNPTRLAQIALMLTTLIWGATFVIVQQALADSPPFAFTGYRFSVAFVVLAAVINIRLRQISRHEVVGGFLCGIALFAGYALQNFGLLYTSATNSAFITSTSVLLVPVLLLFIGKRAAIRVWVAVGFALLGLFILLNPGEKPNVGDLLTAGCALSFAGHIILQDVFIQKDIDPLRFFFIQVIAVTLLAFLHSFLFEQQSTIWSNRLLIALVITGIFATAICYVAMIWAQKQLNPTQTALFFSLEPVSAAAFAVIILGQHLTMMEWIGGSMIVAAVLLAESKSSSSANERK